MIQDLQKQITSSPPTSSVTTGTDINKCHGAANDAMVDTNSRAILTSLTEPTSLYSLPRITLEQLVGDVVREDGFVRLVGYFISKCVQCS